MKEKLINFKDKILDFIKNNKRTFIIIVVSVAVVILGIVALIVGLCVGGKGGAKLGTPEGLAYSNETFTWNEVDGADGYMIHFNKADEVYITDTSASVNNTDVNDGLIDKALNTLYVRAVSMDGEGNETKTSEIAWYEFDYVVPIKKEWKVTLDLNYANSPEAQIITVKNGDKFNNPDKPERYGWNFGGWYRDKQCLVAASNLNVTANTTLYAKWTVKESVKIQVYFYGGSWEQVNVKPYNGETALFVGEGIAMANFAGKDGWFKADIENTATSVIFTNGEESTESTEFDKTKPYFKDGVWTETLPVEQPEETEYAVSIKVGSAALQELKENPAVPGEFMLEDVELKVGDTVVITFNGATVTYYDPDCKFNGRAELDGKYSFYVTSTRIWVETPKAPVELSTVILTVNDDAENAITLTVHKSDDASVVEQYTCTVTLKANDKVKITEGDTEYKYYEETEKFNGTAKVEGKYTFYVKKYADGGSSIWVAVPAGADTPVVSSDFVIYINGTASSVEWVEQASDNANVTQQYTVTVTLKANDKVKIMEGDFEYKNYEEQEKFNGTATVDGAYTFYAKKYKDGGDSVYVAVPSKPNTEAPTTATKVYFYNDKGWANVYVYCWNDLAAGKPNNGDWPGVKMERVGTSNWYVIEIQPGYDKIIFNKGEGGTGNQTENLDFVATDGNAYYTSTGKTDDRPNV